MQNLSLATNSFVSITMIELPSAIVLILLMDIWGRKPLMVRIEVGFISSYKSAPR